MRSCFAAVAFSVVVLASAAHAVAPSVPGSFSYQGVLLDSSGQPQSGPVDLTIRLWDQGFAGTLLYKQDRDNTTLVDGVFSVLIGPTGAGTDVPTNPLTTTLTDALSLDLGASGQIWLEVSVGGGTPLARNQLQAVPFAVKAETAEQAATATNLLTPGGVNATILDAIWLNFNFDGGAPNTDPSEGTADTDGDGILNFVDPDNDNDGFSDAVEIANGSNTNLVTPRIDPFSGTGFEFFPVLLTATGNSFDPAMTVTVGGTSVTPTNVTTTSFDFLGPPLVSGTYLVTVVHPNGETGSANITYTFNEFAVAFDPVEAVALGVDQLLIHADANYFRDTADDGQLIFSPLQSVAGSEDDTTSIHWDSTGRLAALRANPGNGMVELIVDTDLDGNLEATEAIPLEATNGLGKVLGPSLIHDGSDRFALAYLHATAGQERVHILHDRDGNGDFAGTNEFVTAEFRSGSTTGSKALGELAADSAARLAYVSDAQVAGELRVAWDRSGDGDYNDTVGTNPEKFVAATTVPLCLGTDFDGSDALVVVYGDASGLHLLHDLNGDGDFADTGEATTLAPAAQVTPPTGCDVDASGGGLAIAVTDGTSLSLLVDRNGDGDFADTNEDTLAGSPVTGPIAIERLGNGNVVVQTPGGIVEDPF